MIIEIGAGGMPIPPSMAALLLNRKRPAGRLGILVIYRSAASISRRRGILWLLTLAVPAGVTLAAAFFVDHAGFATLRAEFAGFEGRLAGGGSRLGV